MSVKNYEVTFARSRVWGFREMCELLPADVYWGDPLTPSVLEDILTAFEDRMKTLGQFP